MKRLPFERLLALFVSVMMTACSLSDRTTAPMPEFAISDAVHEGGTPGFYFLPPMVAQPTFSGTFDADITTLNPAIAICDINNGPDSNCGGTGGTPAVIVFTTTSTPAITLDLTTPQYQVNWDTQAAGFVASHTYRLHITTTTACGTRSELGFADVLLTTTPGQVKQLATGDLIVMNDGRTLPIHFRIETRAVGNCWTSRAPIPTATSDAAFDVIGGKLYFAGGQVANNCAPIRTLAVYDPAADSWTTGAPMPTARWNSAAGVVNGILYVVDGEGGGCPGPVFHTVEAYDPVTNSWATMTPMPTARYLLAVGVVNGLLYAVGGTDHSGIPFNALEVYDPVANTWTTRAPMPTARYDLTVAVVNGILYTIGGIDGSGYVTTVEAYDPAANTWTTKAPMSAARAGLVSGVVQGMIYVAGGNNATSSSLSALERYDPTSNVWTTQTPMPTARANPMSGVVNNAMYVVGGQIAGPIFLATNEVYHP